MNRQVGAAKGDSLENVTQEFEADRVGADQTKNGFMHVQKKVW